MRYCLASVSACLACLVCLLGACGSGGGSSSCSVGDLRPCTCVEGGDGFKTCGSTGQFGECVCDADTWNDTWVDEPSGDIDANETMDSQVDSLDTTDDSGGDPVDDSVLDTTDDSHADPDAEPDELCETCCPFDASHVSWPATRGGGSYESEPVAIIIEAVDFEADIVRIRNVSDHDIDFDGGWKIAPSPPNYMSLPFFRLSSGASIRIHLRSDGDNDDENMYLNLGLLSADLSPIPGDEISIHSPPPQGEDYSHPMTVQAFVFWGDHDATYDSETLRDEAQEIGLWPSEGLDYVMTTAQDAGIMAVGDISDPWQWEGVPASCFF